MADFKERIDEAVARARELEGMMADPEVAKAPGQMQKIAKELGGLRPLVETGERYNAVVAEVSDTQAMAEDDDAEMAEMARAELEGLEATRTELEEQLTELLMPKDPNRESTMARRLAPCLAAPAALATNSRISPRIARPTRTPTANQPTPGVAEPSGRESVGKNQAMPIARIGMPQFPGSVNRLINQQAIEATTTSEPMM